MSLLMFAPLPLSSLFLGAALAMCLVACEEKKELPAASPAPEVKALPQAKGVQVTEDASGTTLKIGGAPTDEMIRTKATYDPKKFDLVSFLPQAEKLAKKIYSDAKLVHMDAYGVRSSGLADFTLKDDLEATYWFRSPSRSKRPEDAPLGLEVEIPCMVYVVANRNEVLTYPRSFEECEHPFLGVPQCNVRQVWEKARKKGAPANAVANVDYLQNSDETKEWFFNITGVAEYEILESDEKASPSGDFTQTFLDDCKSAP